jgi:transcriptional regulator with XRE-family HTH domain
MNLGNRIKNERLRQRLTQAQLAEATGITLRTLQRIENETVNPSLHSLKSIEKALDIVLDPHENRSEQKVYHFTFSIHLSDMTQLIKDLETLLKNNWKIILIIAVLILFSKNYTEIKSGFMDGWNN